VPASNSHGVPAVAAKLAEQPAHRQQGSGAGSAGEDGNAVDWSLQPPDSCSGYFGNGFSDVIRLVGAADGGMDNGDGSWLTCWHHPSTKSEYCRAKRLRVVPSLVKVTRGGEDLESVMGRSEDDELPRFSTGFMQLLRVPAAVELTVAAPDPASKTDAGAPVPRLDALPASMSRSDHFKLEMLQNMRLIDKAAHTQTYTCSRIVTQPTMFITRVEYANLFHTSTGT
jgi:glycoprotein 2-beta-D-xylosyltransferase